jgi:hypothetical protein
MTIYAHQQPYVKGHPLSKDENTARLFLLSAVEGELAACHAFMAEFETYAMLLRHNLAHPAHIMDLITAEKGTVQ